MEGKRGGDVQEAKQQVQVNNNNNNNSPSHEFSFTVSLPAPPPLSPADEIFFHGHLLPLHFLSNHLPVSPRSSTNSLDSFTLPIKELLHHNTSTAAETKTSSTSTTSSEEYSDEFHRHRHVMEGKGRGKSRSFSTLLFGWKKREHPEEKEKKKSKKASKLEMLKRYMNMRLMKPFIFLRNNRGMGRGKSDEEDFLRQQPFSYSGNLRLKPNKKELRGRREFSAPVSMRNSPTNSGLLVGSGSVTPTNTSSDSTMEELQAAIQAAIAHCKNSINAPPSR